MLFQVLPFLSIFVEFSTFIEVCDQEEKFIPLPDFFQFDNIRVIKLGQDITFVYELVHVFKWILLDDFHSDLLERKPVSC